MVKNKIYNYISLELFKSFILILFSLSLIAWTVRAVNFLDLIVDSGYSTYTYFIYSFLNLTNILTKFIPLSFLLAMLLTIIKLERQNELIILWTSGLSKIKLINIFFNLSVLILIIQLFFAVFVTPNALNKSRQVIKYSAINASSIMLKINEFSDSLKNTTFYVEKINEDGELENIFIRDETNLFSDLIASGANSSNISIFAKTGYLQGKSLILFNGVVQSQNSKEVIEYLNFSKTELFLDNLTSRTIKQPKIQETSTTNLIKCLYDNQFIKNCPPDKIKKEVLQNLSRRIGMPFYIPVVSLVCCFMLFSSTKKDKWYRKYSVFIQGFIILVLAEILVRYSGFSKLNTIIYFVTPFILTLFLYSILLFKINHEKAK